VVKEGLAGTFPAGRLSVFCDHVAAEGEVNMRLRTVIAAVDLRDDLAEAVIETANSFARRDSARLHIVEAWPVLAAAPAGYTPEMAAGAAAPAQIVVEEHERARRLQEVSLATIAKSKDPDARAAVLTGEPGDVVSRYAREVDADLIVTGSHQRGFWGALFTGGGARDLVREAPCAVFLVTKPFAAKLAAGRL
jgi:nucleotide-binding universal stress UspA family protein